MIEVFVYATQKDFVERHSAFRKRVDDDNFHVCYDDIIRANKCLFGSSCVVEFIVM